MQYSGCEIHIERGRIRAVFPNATGIVIRTERDTFEYPGATVLPGLVDAHVHLLGLGKRLVSPSLHRATSEDICVEILQKAPIGDNGWIQAMGWNQELWPHGTLPTSASLNTAFPTTPIVCSRIDGHAFWVNDVALQRAGISNSNGVLVDAEMDAIWKVIPPASRSEIEQQLILASQLFARVGVTEVHDMDVSPEVVAITRELSEGAKLSVRVQSFVSAQNDEWSKAGILPAGGELQRTAGVKMYADGALGSRGAAMLEDYADMPTRGTMLLTEDEVTRKTLDAIHAGWWCVAVHAIGDAAVRTVLNAYDRVRQHPDGADVLLRIEHAQHVHPDDVPRFADLRVTASVQPTHAYSDAAMAVRRLGTARLAHAYRWHSFIDAGVRVSTGTDAPIESVSPLRTIDVATQGAPPEALGWNASERLSCDEAILAATQWAHMAADVDYRRGKIAVGMDADLVILDRPPCPSGVRRAEDAVVMATFTAGLLNAV